MTRNQALALVLVLALLVFVASSASASDGEDDATMTPTPNVRAFAQAIAKAEGFFVYGSMPQRLNNPGDLSEGDFGDRPEYSKVGDERLIQFPTVAAGWDALYRKLANIAAGRSSVYAVTLTVGQMGLKYSGGDPNWARNVANALGTTTDATIGSLL